MPVIVVIGWECGDLEFVEKLIEIFGKGEIFKGTNTYH
jgi:hypothetical protein